MGEQASSERRADTRLWQVAHQAFRLATTRLEDATARLDPSVLRPLIGSRWSFYASVLHHHHESEDETIFPALLAVRPDLDQLVDQLEQDHRQLAQNIELVDAAVSTFEAHPDAAHQETMHDAIRAVRDAFFPHLDVEDAQIIPAVAESIPAQEWARMDEEALGSLPRSQLPMAVASLDEVVRGLPERERPPPPPLLLRVMLAVSWRRKWTAWMKPVLLVS